MATTARSRSPQALDADDAMAMRAAELAAWARRNARTVITVAAVLLVAALAVLMLRYQNQQKAAQAAEAWMQTQDAVQQGATGIPRLTAFAAQYGATAEGAQARLALAAIYLEQNQAPRAVEEARKVAEGKTPLAFRGRMMLGAAQARAGQRDAAIQTYVDAASRSDLKFERQEARSEAALLNEEAGKWAAAAEIYRAMMEDTKEGSIDRSILELRVAEAEARVAAPAPR